MAHIYWTPLPCSGPVPNEPRPYPNCTARFQPNVRPVQPSLRPLVAAATCARRLFSNSRCPPWPVLFVLKIPPPQDTTPPSDPQLMRITLQYCTIHPSIPVQLHCTLRSTVSSSIICALFSRPLSYFLALSYFLLYHCAARLSQEPLLERALVTDSTTSSKPCACAASASLSRSQRAILAPPSGRTHARDVGSRGYPPESID